MVDQIQVMTSLCTSKRAHCSYLCSGRAVSSLLTRETATEMGLVWRVRVRVRVSNLLTHETATEMGLVWRLNQISAPFGENDTTNTEPVKIHLKEGDVP